MHTILVVDDKEMMRDSVAGTFSRAGFAVVTAVDGHSALEQLGRMKPDLVLTDLRMPGMTGVELIEQIRQIDEDLPVVMMTAFATLETAVQAVRAGAYDYVKKPFEGDEPIVTVKRAIEHYRLKRENAVLRASGVPAESGAGRIEQRRSGLDRMIGASAAMLDLRSQLLRASSSQSTVLIQGESGVGKEVLARTLHELSNRTQGAFLAVNCAALSPSLLESELFGHERGAFTGAERMRKGRFELADRGTLLLDEVSEIEPQLQAKLLRVLQERHFERVGSSTAIPVDVRIIATTNRDLLRAVKEGSFREDLYYRLNVVPISVPPLRDRKEDVGPLAEHFVREICRREGRETLGLEPGVTALMSEYPWPGNVRELQNICERAVVLSPRPDAPGICDGPGHPTQITCALIAPWLARADGARTTAAVAQPSGPVSDDRVHQYIESKLVGDHVAAVDTAAGLAADSRTLEEIERGAILAALSRHNGHRQKTARALGIGVRTLGLKLKRWKELQLVAESI